MHDRAYESLKAATGKNLPDDAKVWREMMQNPQFAYKEPSVLERVMFWNKKSDASGISVRTIIANVLFQLVILLYLLDESGTSWVIILGQGIGLVIAAHVRRDLTGTPEGFVQGAVIVVACQGKITV